MTPLSHRATAPLFVALALSVASANTAAGGTLLGVYYGNQGWKMDQVRAMESWQGKKHAVVNLFTDWTPTTKTMNNLFGQQLPNIWNNGNVPMITWEPFTGGQTPVDVEVRVAAGQYDTYIATWSGRLKTFLAGPDATFNTADDRRAYVRLGHEMNGNWYPWSGAVGNNTPADFIALWRRVVGIFDVTGLGPAHVQWVWCINHEDVGGLRAEDYYPGDDYVDWVAIDGYNWGASQNWSSWKSPAQCFDPMLTRLRSFTAKPLALTEFASTTKGGTVAAKSQWIADLFQYVEARDVRLVCWFNEDKETDWAVFGGAAGDGQFKWGRTTYRIYNAYRTAILSPALIPSTPSIPRLLTDAEFGGL